MTSRAYKLRLYPNARQRADLNLYFGAARWVWNRCLEYRTKAYRRRGQSVTGVDFSRLLTRLKNIHRYGWLKDIPSSIARQKLRDQDTAFRNFFAGRARFPRFKRRGGIETVRFALDPRHDGKCRAWAEGVIVVSGLGEIRYRGNNHPRSMPKMVTIRRDAIGHYYASFAVEADIRPRPMAAGTVGVDLGIKHLAVLGDGRKIDNPRHLNRHLKALRHSQRTLSRRVKGSNRYQDARRRVASIHRKVRDTRRDAQHKLTTMLTNENQVVCIEGLRPRNMLRNRRLSRHRADAGFAELHRQLEYKCAWYGRSLVVTDTWFPSSKRCSGCGYTRDELELSARAWTCPKCGNHHDRDVNAAVNILYEGLRQLVPEGIGELRRVEGVSAGLPASVGETLPGEARIVYTGEPLYGTAARR